MESHLSDDQIEDILHLASKGDDGSAGRRVQIDAQNHLDSCDSCRLKVKAQETVMRRLATLQFRVSGQSSPKCPAEEVWAEIAAGIFTRDPDSYLSHAASCDHCGPLLNQAVSDFATDLTSDEDSVISDLPSSTTVWQKTLAARLSDIGHSETKKRFRSEWRSSWITAILSPRRVAFAASGVGLIAFGMWFAERHAENRSAEQLIADAYAERRTLEVRIGDVPYVPLRQTRGADSEQERMSRPALLKAEAEIAQQIRSHPYDIRWLQASGRASLLEDNLAGAEAAIAVLEHAQRLAPNNASVSIDRASAYILRGQFLNRSEDYGTSIEILGRVLSSNRGGDTAQFNYAVALEKELFKSQAVEAWKTYLARYPRSTWAVEAQERLVRLQQEIHDQHGRSESPLKTLDQLAAAFAGRRSGELSEIDARIEEYQDLTVQQWLPLFFLSDQKRRNPARTVEQVLNGLARLLSEQHNDPWLRDLLGADRDSRIVDKAVRLLADSERKIEVSDDDHARDEASAALSLFHRAGVSAGEMRARFVLIFLKQIEHRDWPCESMAQAMRREPTLQAYAWLRIQVQLEDSLCAGVADKQALEAARSGIELSNAHHFPILNLRAIAVTSALYSSLGDEHGAWSTAIEGLRFFWSGTYPTLRGYNALIALDELNFSQDRWFLESAILKEATPMVADDPRTNMVAAGLARLGQTLLQTGDFDGAEKSYLEAQHLLASSAPGLQRDALHEETELGYAKIDEKRNELSASLGRLERIRPALLQIPDDLLVLDFYQTSGIAEMRSNHLLEAEKDLTAAASLAEKSLRLLETEDDRWKWSHHSEPIYRGLVETKLHRDAAQALLDWEWYKAAALRDRDSESSRESRWHEGLPSQLDKTLAYPEGNDGALVVSYVLFPQGYSVWVWDRTSLKQRWIPLNESELSSLVMRFAEHCSDPHSDPASLRMEGAALYRMIVLPIEPWIVGRRHLIFEPDGVLKALPIGLLVNSGGEYLFDNFAITVSPGIAYLNRSRKWLGISPRSNAFIFGDPMVPGWMPLPDADQEARAVAACFSHPKLQMQTDLSPTELAKRIAEAEVFHFSGHAKASVESAELVAGTDGLLEASEFNVVSGGDSRLVVLSACSSSHGTSGLFDDGDSLVRRFMGARVPEVVASRWNVDSAATALLMKEFYTELLAGKAVSEALNSAMRSVRSRSEFSHPYYWAGFSVFGRS